MDNGAPEKLARKVIAGCADCDVCRYLMDETPCLVFPELFRLYDLETEFRESVTSRELRHLVDLCNFCALCPCSDVRTNIMKAKQAFVERDGLKPAVRWLEDVRRVSGICGAFPRLTHGLFSLKGGGKLIRRLAGIHRERAIPRFPEESFRTWFKKRRPVSLNKPASRKVAFFAGCTGQYLFPEVPRAAVEILENNGIEVVLPEQQCCGMPSLLEGDRDLTYSFAWFNLERLSAAVEEGLDIVCSCPTCGFVLKAVMSQGAFYGLSDFREAGSGSPSSVLPFRRLLRGLIHDEGYFAGLDARVRLLVSQNTYDLGEYLKNILEAGKWPAGLFPVPTKLVYYPPCHLREQKIGEPYWDLLRSIPGVTPDRITGSFNCCGMAGIMGFKREFHETSLAMGRRLMERINALRPEMLVTDCLSCRLQFNQCLPYPVRHPIEVLRDSISPG